MVKQLTPATQLFLNVLRVSAAQAVLWGHCRAFVFGTLSSPMIENIAVMLFFILSGFLISFSLFRKNFNVTFTEFFLARFCRIYCGLIPALIFIALIDGVFIHLGGYSHHCDYSVKAFLGNVFMLQNFPYFHIPTFGSGRPLWTLNIEWWLYMFFGWFLLKCLFNLKIKFNGLLLLMFFALMPFRNKCDLAVLWMLGAISVFLINFKNLVKNKNVLIGGGVFFTICLIAHAIKYRCDYDLKNHLFLFSAFVFVVLYMEKVNSIPFETFSIVVKFFADYSFTLYLIHYSICEMLIKYTKNLFLLIAIPNLCAMILAEFCEKKHKRLYTFFKSGFKNGKYDVKWE